MQTIYTIGFTKKSAQDFFELLINNKIDLIVDIRLNNTSQLAAFAKYPDIKYFLKKIYNISYIHDTTFSPTELTLKRYKKKEIDWNTYVDEFSQTMAARRIEEYIGRKFFADERICLLCSESTADRCHRGLVANIFKKVKNIDIIHL
ncbi:DUF488 domain-containing protein [Alkalicella caledoniensis]|uniref:DUF488 domain-containing protein n=2 Tax=Alkalicella caledoniensis TaxID=2731377 RepID=A0A7G9WDF5_ALKCA|nr:DUF488 domain-containing protein [Alkalicella caledoniensis]